MRLRKQAQKEGADGGARTAHEHDRWRIGGTAAASALQRAGMRVTVFERNHELREVGAGLTLWANGVQALQELGLASAIAAVSAPLTHFEC